MAQGPERHAPDDEQEEAAMAAYRAVHRSLSSRVERFLMHALILLLSGMAVVQTLQTSGLIRRHLPFTPTEALEGIAWSEVSAWPGGFGSDRAAAGSRTAAVSGAQFLVTVVSREFQSPTVRLLVNGKPVGDFRDGEVQAAVLPGQTLTVDARAVKMELSFEVTANGGLASPGVGHLVQTRGNQVNIGKAERP